MARFRVVEHRTLSDRPGSGYTTPAVASSVREAVREAKKASRGGRFVCVHGDRQRKSDYGNEGGFLQVDAVLGCFLNGRRSTLSLPADLQRGLREQNKRR